MEDKTLRTTCLQCGGPIPKERQHGWTKYCSIKCNGRAQYIKLNPYAYKPVRTTCMQCGGPIPIEKQHFLTRYCSRKCRSRVYYIKLNPYANKPFRITCMQCGGPIPPKRQNSNTKYCSDKCQKRASNIKYRLHRKLHPKPTIKLEGSGTLSTFALGSVGESMACIDLIKKGYQVFKAFLPGQLCDLVILKDNKFETTEVRVGRIRSGGGMEYTKPKTKVDVIAVVLPDKVVYKRPGG